MWTYPSLFQSSGGLQNQIFETMSSLTSKGCVVSLVDLVKDDLSNFDLIHIFSAAHGNHVVARLLSNRGIPFVVSPVLQAYWDKKFSYTVNALSWVIGFSSRWRMRTEYDHYRSCMFLADRVIALGGKERKAVVQYFGVDSDGCCVIPNGVAGRFYDAEEELFCKSYGLMPGYVLCVGLVGEWKNQKMVARAAERHGLQAVVIGSCKKEDQEYLASLKSLGNVVYIDHLPYESELLASAYAGACALCLPSASEVMPLTVLEALAAGTPAVLTRNNSMDLRCNGLHLVDPASLEDVCHGIARAIAQRDMRSEISTSVSHLSWDSVGDSLVRVYKDVLTRRLNRSF